MLGRLTSPPIVALAVLAVGIVTVATLELTSAPTSRSTRGEPGVLASAAALGRPEAPTSTPRSAPVPVPLLASAPSSAPPLPRFTAGGKPFRFVGAFVPNGHFRPQWWDRTADEDLIRTAKATGITVLDILPPPFERPLGVYDEAMLVELDHFLDAASRHGVYVSPKFIQAWGMTLHPEGPYYHPAGIEGLITDQRLAQALKANIRTLVLRKNTVNGRVYRDDPTILGWQVCDEPLGNPASYPQRPNVSMFQLNAWLAEMVSYVKGLDPNHLVGINITAAMRGWDYQNWSKSVDVPSLDFIEFEECKSRSDFAPKLYALGKPMIAVQAFTCYEWEPERISRDYPLQAQMLRDRLRLYQDEGLSGVVVFSWGSDLYLPDLPFSSELDRALNYTASNKPITQVLLEAANRLNPPGYPTPPLQFVRIYSPIEFNLGFKLLADRIPDIVGQPVENEWHNPDNGDGLQRTTTGMMVWRKADNWTAFTNGSRTWINGPFGIQERGNEERFDWESQSS